MKLFFINLVCLFFVFNVKAANYTIQSPDKKLQVVFSVSKTGELTYTVKRNNNLVIQSSKLGLIRDDADFSTNLSLIKVGKTEQVFDNYELAISKRLHHKYHASKQVFHLKNDKGNLLDIIFQISNDGVAFRYFFPEKSADIKIINKELTTFKFNTATKAWLQPMSVAKTGWERTNPSYEEFYEKEIPVGKPAPLNAGWVYPALFNTNKNWVLITETFPDKDYCGTKLATNSPNGEYAIEFPDAREVFTNGALNPESKLPWYTPWRILTIGDLKTIVESTLGTDLAAPAKIKNVADFKPGISSWSWVLLKDDSTVYNVQKKFVDYAAEMKWDYCLVDADWDRKIGKEKITELANYAKQKNVSLILWYNSAGAWNTVPYTPKQKFLTAESREEEFKWLKSIGVKGIKVDFFGGDGKSMMDYYIDIIETAAKYGIMVNCHGSTLPRGIQRTYPNLVTMEAIKGMEFRTFEQANEDVQPQHCAVIPFTRNVFDPMDYTPMVLNKIPRINKKTSSAFELATTVLFHSGVQHIAETPKGLAEAPSYIKAYLQNLPKSWDDIQFIDGYPGEYAIIARKSNNKWYIAGINANSTAKTINLNLSFLQKNAVGELITDGKDNLNFSSSKVKNAEKLTVTILPNSGFVMIF